MAQKRWHSFLRFSLALVAQLDRASASEAEGCWFDSSRGHFFTRVGRWVQNRFVAFALMIAMTPQMMFSLIRSPIFFENAFFTAF